MTAPANLQPPRPQPVRRASKDPAHLPLHRRLLFPYGGLDSDLPKLVDGSGQEVDLINERLYHLIALALRAYVLSWYTRISPRDRSLLPSINSSVLTPLLQSILTSLYNDSSSLVNLLLIDLPTILHLHVTTYRRARHQTSLDYGNLGDNYHARLPVLSVEKQDEAWQLSPLYLTSLADGVLKNGLSVEEYGSTVERLMVRELLGRTILGGVGRRLSEPWFWYGLLLKFLGEAKASNDAGKSPRQASYRESYSTRLTRWLSKIWSIVLALWTVTLSIIALYSAAPTPRSVHRQCAAPWTLLLRALTTDGTDEETRPISTRLLFGAIDTVATIASPVLDRILPRLIETRLLTPSMSLKLIDLLERILFPLDGYPAPTPPDPTLDETEQMRRSLEKRLDDLIPLPMRGMLVPGGSTNLLNPMSSRECNAHLVGMVLDSVVATIVPDLVVTGR